MQKFKKTRVSLAIALLAGGHIASLPANGESLMLEEVLVTARKRVEASQDVPLSITAVNEQVIIDNNITNLFGLERVTPNMALGADGYSGLSAIVAIRGQRIIKVGTNEEVRARCSAAIPLEGRSTSLAICQPMNSKAP